MKKLVLALLLLLAPVPLLAAEPSHVPPSYGLATLNGAAYDPEHIGLSILQGFVLYDYDQIFWHAAPDPLRLKFEANLGITSDGRERTLASLNMLAFYYLPPLGRHWRPYGEAGIGLIYTDFHVDGQGLHLNFNPQFGAGLEYALEDERALFGGLRFHHLSNGNLYSDNRGINTLLMTLGMRF